MATVKKEKQLDSLKMFRELVKKGAIKLTDKHLQPGNMVTFSYNAKDKNQVWDKTPLCMVLRRSKGYTLGLNFHWVPTKARAILLDYIFKRNTKNIKNGNPLEISYKEVKSIIAKLKLRAVVRLYINSRISSKGIPIPQEHMRKAIDLPSENFIGVSAEKAYSMMVKKSKTKR